MENVVEQFKLLIKQIILNFKYIFHNKKNLFLFSTLPMLALIIPTILAPIQLSFPAFITAGAILPSSLLYCSTTFEWRKGTLYPNLLISKNNKYLFYLSSFIMMIIVALMLYILLMFFMILLNNINLLQTYWGFSSGGDRYLDFSKLYLLPAFYSVFEATLIMFSILFMAQNILKTNVSLYVLVFAIQLIEIIFGGIFTQFFLWTVDLTSDEGHAYAIPYYHALAFPDSSYWFASVINPLFAPSMHMQAFSSKWEYKCSTGMSSYGAGHEFNFWIWETTSNTFGSLSRIEIYKWNSLWISPYIWTGSFAGLGILVSSLKK